MKGSRLYKKSGVFSVCEHCEKIEQLISTMVTQMKVSGGNEYEYSEPMSIGGPASSTLYKLRSPFNSPNVQWALKSVSAGGGANPTVFVIGNDPNIVIPPFASSDNLSNEISPIKAIVQMCPASNSIPHIETWHDLTDSNSILYIGIGSTTTAGYAVIQFRRKR